MPDKKRLNILGLNSGTSADGLDLAAVTVDRSRGGYRVRFREGRTRKYPAELRRLVLELADSTSVDLERLIRIDRALGLFFGQTAAAFMRRLQRRGVRIDAVASHGQTVRHVPQRRELAGYLVGGSLQLGHLEQIAVTTDRIVIGDFRQADIALGREGAPITTAAMQRLFGAPDESRLIVNLGGMSNFFYFPSGRAGFRPAAADCGPGNSLSDLLCQKLFGMPYDRGGALARAGTVSLRLLSLLRSEPFFTDRTASTGREAFGLALADRVRAYGRKLRLGREDIVATAAELTVVSIVTAIRSIVERDARVDKLYLTGGGVQNRFFTRRLRESFEGVAVESIAALGYRPDLVEATAYAVMGEACLQHEALPTEFGRAAQRKRQPVLGRLVQPPRKG